MRWWPWRDRAQAYRRSSGPAHGPGSADRPAGSGRPDQPGDRRAAVHQYPDGRVAPAQGVRQARRQVPRSAPGVNCPPTPRAGQGHSRGDPGVAPACPLVRRAARTGTVEITHLPRSTWAPPQQRDPHLRRLRQRAAAPGRCPSERRAEAVLSHGQHADLRQPGRGADRPRDDDGSGTCPRRLGRRQGSEPDRDLRHPRPRRPLVRRRTAGGTFRGPCRRLGGNDRSDACQRRDAAVAMGQGVLGHPADACHRGDGPGQPLHARGTRPCDRRGRLAPTATTRPSCTSRTSTSSSPGT